MSVFGWSLKDWLHTGFLCSPLTIGNIGTEKVRFYSTLQNLGTREHIGTGKSYLSVYNTHFL